MNLKSTDLIPVINYRTVLSQFVYCLGGSGFAGANGSVMIEVVVRIFLVLNFCLAMNVEILIRYIVQPFFHILATDIAEQIGDEYPKEIIATTLVAYALSSILTGQS
jgi:sulfate permease, SulP family